MSTEYLVKYYLSHSVFTNDDAVRLRNSIEARSRQVIQLMRHSDWRAGVFNYEIAKEGAILHILLQLRLMIELVQILTPPMMTIKRIDDEECDVIDDLHGLLRLMTLA